MAQNQGNDIIYAVHPKLQSDLVDRLCFKKCGRIGMAFLHSSIGVLAPCKVAVCPYAEGEMEFGECDQGPVVLRKLKDDKVPPVSPLKKIWGKWPGDEPIDDILDALRRMDG